MVFANYGFTLLCPAKGQRGMSLYPYALPGVSDNSKGNAKQIRYTNLVVCQLRHNYEFQTSILSFRH